jgi:prolipoprotein diacylglyceryltransferase
MHPILFKIPGLGFPIRSFGVMLAIGFLTGSWILGKLAERYGDDPKEDPARYSRITVWVLAGVVLGARLMYVIVEIGRVGCLLVGDDYGRVVPERFAHLPFPITLRVPSPLPEGSLFGLENEGKLLWATEPWMSAKALIVAFVGWQILKRRRYAGQVALWTILLYAMLRSFVEAFRGDEVRGVWFGGAVSTSQLVSMATGLAAVVLLLKNRGRSDPLPAG